MPLAWDSKYFNFTAATISYFSLSLMKANEVSLGFWAGGWTKEVIWRRRLGLQDVVLSNFGAFYRLDDELWKESAD